MKKPWGIIPVLSECSGMALVMVLAVISILLVAALELSRQTGVLAVSAARQADYVIAHERAMSGVHLAMALLCDDAAKTSIDSIQEDWGIRRGIVTDC